MSIRHPISDEEVIVRSADRSISLLVARQDLSITRATYAAGQRVAGPHIHHGHTDAFYVLEGELTFEVGPDGETVTLRQGGFVAVPPGVTHAFRTSGTGPARWLTFHAADGGFAEFMRGLRDGIPVEWDIAPCPSGSPTSTGSARSTNR